MIKQVGRDVLQFEPEVRSYKSTKNLILNLDFITLRFIQNELLQLGNKKPRNWGK